MSHHVGILAYGSLIDDPGLELAPLIKRRMPALTPFNVEFARSSRKRDGGPTLIPVDAGGSSVNGQVLVLEHETTKDHAANMLWRRETGKDGNYRLNLKPTANTVIVEYLNGFVGVQSVLYTKIGSNITDLTPSKLAELAIDSAKGEAGKLREDGISYLLSAKKAGIKTPLSDDYERAILQRVGVDSLDRAVEAIRSG